MSVQIGAIEGLIRLRDEFVGPLNRAGSQLDKFGRAADDVGTRVSRMGDRVGKALAFGAVLAGVGAAVRSVYQNVAEAQKAMAQLEAGVRSTGGAAGYSAEQLAEMATRFQRLTAVEDEQIMSAQGILLTFRNIGHDAFPRALQAALDLSARGFGPLETTMKMVGKAADMPKQGITALSRAGVQFSETQKKTIEVLVDTGRVAEAQGLIFEELEKQVGGSAEAFRNTLPGAVAALSNAWGDLLEQVGQSADGGGFFMTGINGMVSALEWLKDNWVAVEVAVFETLAKISRTVAEAVSNWIAYFERFAAFLQLINPGAWFGPGKKTIDDIQATLKGASRTVDQLGKDLQSGFKQKATDALNAAYEPAKKLKGALGSPGGMAAGAAEASDKARKLAADLAELRGELTRSAETSRKLAAVWRAGGADPKKTEEQARAIERTAKLHEQYLRDVDKFGRAAAEALRVLRADQDRAAESARKAEESYKGLIEAFEKTGKLSGQAFVEETSKALRAGGAKLVSDAEEILRRLDLRKSLSQEVEFQVRLSGVEDFGGQLGEIEAAYVQFLRDMGEGSVDAGEQFMAAQEAIFSGFIEGIYADLQKLSDIQVHREIRGASDSSFEIYRRERERIESYLSSSVDRTSKEWEDGTAYLAQRSQEFWSDQISTWTGVFDQLADRFGGFFNYLSQAARTLQQAQSTSSSVSSAASGLGASSGLASALGAFGAYVVIAMAIYDAFKSHAEARQARKYTLGAVVSMTDGDWNYGQMAEASEKLSNEIKKVVDAIADSVGGLLTGFADLEIQVRRDGKYFRAFVEGELIGQFESMEDAVDAAIMAAFGHADTTIAGVSAEFVRALQFTAEQAGATLDTLRENIETAARVRAARIGEAGTQFLETIEEWNREIRAADRTGQAIGDLIAARDREAAALKNSVLGIDTAVSDQLRAIRSLNDGMVEAGRNAQAQLEAQIRAGQEQLARLIAAHDVGPREGGGSGTGGGAGAGGGEGGRGGRDGGRVIDVSSFDPAIAELQAQIDRWLEELGRVPQGLSEMEINMGVFDALFRHIEGNQQLSRKYEADRVKYARMKVEIEFESIRLQLVAMGKWEQFASMFTDAYNSAIGAAGERPGGRSGGGGSSRDSVRDFITDREWELAARSMGEFERAVAETRRQYDEQIAQAGRDAGLRAQVIALRERELALMAEERRARTTTDFRQFLGLVNQFDQVRETAAALVRQIEDSPYGDARKARMIGRVMQELDAQLDRLVRETGRDLLSGLIGDLERFGASETLLTQARRQMAVLEHTLKMEHYRVEIEILRAQGRIAPQILATMDEAFRFLAGIDPTSLLTGTGPAANDNEAAWAWRQGPNGYYLGPRGGEGGETGATPVDDFGDALKKATELLSRYRTDGLDPLRRRLIEITGDFRTIRSAMGDTADVMSAYSRAVQSAMDDFLEPVRAARRNLFYGQASSADTMTQWSRMQSEFADLQRRFAAGDLSVVEGIDSFAQQFMDLARLVSPVGSEGLRFWESALDSFLAQIERVDVADLGTAGNPMTVDGIGDLALLSEAQLNALNRLYESNERVVAALEQQNAVNYSAHALVA